MKVIMKMVRMDLGDSEVIPLTANTVKWSGALPAKGVIFLKLTDGSTPIRVENQIPEAAGIGYLAAILLLAVVFFFVVSLFMFFVMVALSAFDFARIKAV